VHARVAGTGCAREHGKGWYGTAPTLRGTRNILASSNLNSGTGEILKITHAMVAATITATAMLAGCASAPEQASSSTYYPAASSSNRSYYGVVDSIQMTPARANSGTGAVIGGVVGGLLGNQVGGGNGKAVATVAGLVGGAVVGNQIEKNNKAQARDMYQVSVRLDDGGFQTITQDSPGDLRVGDRARIENGRVYRY